MRHVIFIGIILSLLAMSGLALAGIIGNTNKEIRTIADPLLDNILDGMKTNDYATWSKDFNDTMREAGTQQTFLKSNRQIRDEFGSYKSRTYLGFLNKGDMTLVLWKGSFDKTRDDVLIKLVVSKRKGKYVVTGLWFH